MMLTRNANLATRHERASDALMYGVAFVDAVCRGEAPGPLPAGLRVGWERLSSGPKRYITRLVTENGRGPTLGYVMKTESAEPARNPR